MTTPQRRPVGCGIDFGTSNSLIAVAYDNDDIEVVDMGSTAVPEALPSLVYLDREGLRLTGEDASSQFMITGAQYTSCSNCSLVDRSNGVQTDSRQYVPGGGCSDSRLLSGLKFDMAEPSFTGTNSWARDFPLPQLVADVLRRLKKAGEEHAGAPLDAVSLGRPFVFYGAEGRDHLARQRVALERLDVAAALAGFTSRQLVPEPQAAALMEDAESGVVVTVDFGAGTFDVAVVDFDLDPPKLVALDGAPVGGELIDRAIFRDFIEPHLGFDISYRSQSGAQLGLPAEVRSQAQSLSQLKRLMQDRNTAVLLRAMANAGAPVASLDALLYQGQAYRFYQSIETAKIELSRGATVARVDLRRLGINEVVDISRPDLEGTLRQFLDPVERAIDRALTSAGIEAHDVAYAVRTGGSSQLPQFIDLLNGKFGPNKVQARDPFTTVVTGLALDAAARWAA
ncbi:MAG: Hsp70 family protein [Chloroflexota bacterium]|nr:Hsp70 family protein [Chloroflexota bacterium]